MKYRILKFGTDGLFKIQMFKIYRIFSFLNGWEDYDCPAWPGGRCTVTFKSIESAKNEILKIEKEKKDNLIGWRIVT